MNPTQYRELLELATKAAELRFGTKDRDKWIGVDWNPLTDDGDALRLAAHLGIDVLQRCVGGRCSIAIAPGGEPAEEFLIDHGGDRLPATRLAIVRAAAAIGAKK